MNEAKLDKYTDAAAVILNRGGDADAYQTSLFATCAGSGKTRTHRELFKRYNAGTSVDELRRELAAIDLEYFGRAYLHHYFERKSPAFHGELNDIWLTGVLKGKDPYHEAEVISKMDGCRRAIAAPRGHAKSTNLTFKNAIHAILYRYKHYILILSDSSDQAEGFLEDIAVEFEDNPLIIRDFGELEGNPWNSGVIRTTTDIKVEAIGSGKKVRGRRHRNYRPDLIILDDIENDENVRTPEQRTKLSSWFDKAVSKAGDTYTDFVYIGTMLHYDSLLAKVMKKPDYKSVLYKGVISFATDTQLWAEWENIYTNLANEAHEADALTFFEANKPEMLNGSAVLWEEKQSYYKLMCMKVSEGEASFNSEIQNEPVDPESCLFNPEWFDYYNEAEIDFRTKEFIFIGAVDPSLGKNKRSDTSAIIVLAKNTKTGYIYVLKASVERRKPDAIIDDVLDTHRQLCRDYIKGFSRFGVEVVQFQQFFKDILAQKSAAQGLYLPVEEIQSLAPKHMRIQSLQPFIKNGYIKFNERHKTLLEQLKVYPMGRNDDGPDGLEMAVKLALGVKGSTAADYKSVIGKIIKFKQGAF